MARRRPVRQSRIRLSLQKLGNIHPLHEKDRHIIQRHNRPHKQRRRKRTRKKSKNTRSYARHGNKPASRPGSSPEIQDPENMDRRHGIKRRKSNDELRQNRRTYRRSHKRTPRPKRRHRLNSAPIRWHTKRRANSLPFNRTGRHPCPAGISI